MRDVEGALAWLREQADVDPERIGILGESMGAVTAIRAAATLPDIRAVVVDSAYPDLEEGIGNIWRGTGLPAFPFVPLQIALGEWRTGLELEAMQPLEDVAAISPRPILILAGRTRSRVLMPVSATMRLPASRRSSGSSRRWDT